MLKKYWPHIASAFAFALPYFAPGALQFVEALAKQYPHATIFSILALVLGAYHATSPNAVQLPGKWQGVGTGAGKVAVGALFLLLFWPSALSAQTPTGLPFTVAGNYSASTNNLIPQGVQSTFEYNISKTRWSVRLDDIKQGSVLSNYGGGQWGITADRIFGKSAPASFANIRFNIHAGLGAVKNAAGAMNFAALAGVSVDYKVSSIFFLRLAEFNDGYSRGYSPNNQTFGGNYNSTGIGSGIGFNF